MANEIRIASSLTSVQDVEETTGGNTYNINQIDTNALRSFGGKYNSLTAYGDSAIARYTGVVVGQVANTTLTGHAWTEAADVTDGTLPTTIHAIAVEYVSELGTVGDVTVAIKQADETELEMASLDLGESVVIPIHQGLPLAELYIGCDAYSNGVNEATVNVLILGV